MAHPALTALDPPRQFFVEHDVLRIAALDWGGAPGARPVLLLHPNGFCAGFFDPLARRLAAGGAFHPVGVDLRGHGDTDKPEPPEPYRYPAMAGDVAAVADACGFDTVDVVGNSLGGGVAVHLDKLQPGRAGRLVLCEPIVLPIGPGQGPVSTAQPMAAAALRRKVVWPSREAMVHSYGSRPPMDRLAPEALAAYIEWGTHARPDGEAQRPDPGEHAGQRRVLGDAHGAVGLHGVVDDLQRHQRHRHLDPGDLGAGGLVAGGVHQPGGVEGVEPGLVDVDAGVGHPGLDHALLGQWLAERAAGVGPLAHELQRPFGGADRPHAVVDAARAEAGLGDGEAAAFLAEQ